MLFKPTYDWSRSQTTEGSGKFSFSSGNEDKDLLIRAWSEMSGLVSGPFPWPGVSPLQLPPGGLASAAALWWHHPAN